MVHLLQLIKLYNELLFGITIIIIVIIKYIGLIQYCLIYKYENNNHINKIIKKWSISFNVSLLTELPVSEKLMILF